MAKGAAANISVGQMKVGGAGGGVMCPSCGWMTGLGWP